MQLLKNLYLVGGDLHGITFDEPGAFWNDGNCYALKTEMGIILFDCGCGNTIDQIFSNLKYWGLNPDDIHHCILTHPHFDHAGAGSILKKMGVQLIALAETADAVSKGDERCCGFLYHKEFVPFEVDRIVGEGETLDIDGLQIEVISVPGHSMGCTAYAFVWDEKRVIVCGDLIGTLLSGDFGWSGSIDFNKKHYINSLRKLARLDSDIMLPGHGMPYFHKPRRRVEDVLNAALMQWR
ncbi:MBL fold metallo-hydrolase [Dyadobacter sp. CY312]|uniref:MBL fold metallo-hydrolase n=1 Tax=Dyadobacter sp. CY312 TaxID=2907303 RepID=UPI001F36FB85|nr:MBL fold metallo-hydrolase [Dyadobacter sp. CY312]MCE7043208.1 MBL fold metallo-hydrolase [Dyadobacter sp. CY312]